MEKKHNIQALVYPYPGDGNGVNPRCLSALPSNIEDLIYIFKNQEKTLGAEIQAIIENKKR